MGIYDVGPTVNAANGSATAIQAAVNSISGRGTVQVPAGNFNWVPTNTSPSSWTTVTVPAGINVIGAPPSGFDSLGIPTSWGTVITSPIPGWGDPDSYPPWFAFEGNYDDNMPSRFGNIKLVGYRSAHSSNRTLQSSIALSGVIDFRVDHSCFEHCPAGITIWGDFCCGVIDHNRNYNIYGDDNLDNYMDSSVGYGVELHRGWDATNYFEPTASVLGKYTKYTVFIENNYMSRWRHVVSSGHGAYYVFRYNLIDGDIAHFSMDVHGLRDATTTHPYAGGRGAEIYENTLTNADQDFAGIFQDGGGCGTWFNNYIDSSYWNGITLYSEDDVASPIWHLKDFYLWSAKGISPDVNMDGSFAGRNVAYDWARNAGNPTDANYPNANPAWSIAGYKPYTYPHPLTNGVIPATRLRINSVPTGVAFTLTKI